MTYQEKIEEMIKKIESIYDEAEGMRDIADLDEKKYWNELRGIFYDAAEPLKKLNYRLSKERASMEID
ncbi:hypothetical protein V9K67_26750 [Paraflavisolibacter sp. H34]|uniref:hypothetical protein n=1 Tax=Huijunlia imazamoxiresistens TaxID=3127457 RepID=UPI003016C416